MVKKELSPTTTWQVSKNTNREADTIVCLGGLQDKKNGLVEPIIHELFKKFRPLIFKAIETGQFIDFDFSVNAKLREIDMVCGQYPVAFDTPKVITDSINFEQIESQFARLNIQRQKNKQIFKECIDKNFPPDPQEQKRNINSTKETTTIKVKQPLKWEEQQKI